MKNNLKERYIYAVTKRMPEKTKDDVSNEISTLIDDMLEERCGDVTPTEKDIIDILTELGTPLELYEKYNADGDKCLIGSPYYTPYVFVLKIVFVSILIGMVVLGLIKGITSLVQSDVVIDSLESVANYMVSFTAEYFTWGITAIISSLIASFGFITILFAIFHHYKIDIQINTDLKSLPPIPKKNEIIPKWEPITGIIFTIIFTVILLSVPEFFSLAVNAEGKSPYFIVINSEAIKSSWYLIILLAIIGIIRECVDLLKGQYTKKSMIITIIANSFSAVISCAWLLNYQIFNSNIADVNVQWAQNIALGFILLLILIDTMVYVFKTTRIGSVEI